MNLALINNLTETKLTSIQVSEITGKRHSNVLRDIREEFSEELDVKSFSIYQKKTEDIILSSYIDSQNKEQSMYELDKNGMLRLLARYDKNVRKAIVHKIDSLEKANQLLIEENLKLTQEKLQLMTDKTSALIEANHIVEQELLTLKPIESLMQEDQSLKLAIVVQAIVNDTDRINTLGLYGFLRSIGLIEYNDKKKHVITDESLDLNYGYQIKNTIFITYEGYQFIKRQMLIRI